MDEQFSREFVNIQHEGLSEKESKGFESLKALALDLHFPWNHHSNNVWYQLDPILWEFTHNPWIILQTVSKEKLTNALADPHFCGIVKNLLDSKYRHEQSEGWFQKTHPEAPISCVAYFSMEFMLSEALPIYSGGLGNVAGDQLKAASDLGVPVVAVGLLYQQGYFRQMIDKDGVQQALYPYNDPGQLPITPLRKSNGEWLRLEVTLPGWSLWLRTWQVQVGRVKLYLLDSNDGANYPPLRGITSELYGGGLELRLKQELVLGIGGWRLLNALGIRPEVCHLNEGHAAFAILERTRCFIKETGLPFEAALAATRAGNIFTTHTAVPAGFDRFSSRLIEQHLKSYAKDQLRISMNNLLALGRLNPEDVGEDFNMAYLAIRGCGAVNGVSLLHSEVSKNIFKPLFPRWPEQEIPVGYVTNGVHMPSWESDSADNLWADSCGKKRWLGDTETLEKEIRTIPSVKLWEMRNASRKSLIEYARERLARQLGARGCSIEELEEAMDLFDPHTLTLGFARRFATYKRPNMLLQDQQRLIRILNNPQRPVQLILAGKAHPADKPGQVLIQEWMHFIQHSGCRSKVIFLNDYDMYLTKKLVQGVDVWINTPRRPWEACGTSGMKVLVNGGLNLSELDGWWAEAYTPDVGWALGDGQEHGVDPTHDYTEASALYDLLENKIIPEFYTRDSEGISIAWTERIRESMAKLTPQYSANRSVREYTEKYYVPAATNYHERAAENGIKGSQIMNWKHNLSKNWHNIRFGEVKITENNLEEKEGIKVTQLEFEVQVYLSELDPNSVIVELYAENGTTPERYTMQRIRQLKGQTQMYIYTTNILTNRTVKDFTPRVIPYYPSVSVPLEANQILWQR